MTAATATDPGAFILLARGPQRTLTFSLRGPKVQILGREGGGADFTCPDSQISRRHADVRIDPAGGGILVQRLPDSLNRVFLLGPDGQFHDQKFDRFRVAIGQTFAIGSTYFTLQPDKSSDDPLPSINVSFSPDVLRQARMPELEARLQAILALPTVLAQTTTEEALQREALAVLLTNLPDAGLVSLVFVDENTQALQTVIPELTRPGQGVLPVSSRLIHEALQTGQAILYHWDGANAARPGGTIVNEPTWAACLSLGHRGRCLYIAGRSSSILTTQSELGRSPRWQGDLKFLELVGSLLGSLLSARDLQARHTVMQGFLPPPVLAWLETMPVGDQLSALNPTQVELTIMFCDLAGFSRMAERYAPITHLFWRAVQHALSVMTQSIREQEGVVVDFQGDSVLAVWGWPETATTSSDPASASVRRAARAALTIQERFPEVQASFDELHKLHPDPRQTQGEPPRLRCGVALTTGPALVGYLGTAEMGGVDVFGHTVNRAARVQSLTRTFQTPILVDDSTSRRLGENLPDWCRIDPLIHVRLAGMDEEAAVVSQLTGVDPRSPGQGPPQLTARETELLDNGAWDELRATIPPTPAERGFRRFLQELLIAHGYQAPADWNGIYSQQKGG